MSTARASVFAIISLALVACGGGDDSTAFGEGDGRGPSANRESRGGGGDDDRNDGDGRDGETTATGPVPTGACVIKADVRKSTTWSKSACPDGYLVKFETRVTGAGVALTIEPGTVVKHQGSGMLIVEDGAAIRAVGSPAEKIRFTSLDGAPASWRGLRITSDSVDDQIAHAVIEHAGSSSQTRAALTLASDGAQSGRLALADTEIVDNARLGLAMYGDAKLTSFDRVTVKRNEEGAIHVQAPLVPQLQGAGNAIGVAFVEAYSLAKVDAGAKWPSLAPAVYRIVGQNGKGGDILQVQAHLEIEAGTVIELAPGSGVLVAGGASGLRAVGTADETIVFRGVGGSGWEGITFGESTWTENRLEHVEVRSALKAPSWGHYGTGNTSVKKAGILVGYNFSTPVQLTVKDFVVAGPNNAPADVAVRSGTTLVQQGSVSGTGAGGTLVVESF